MANWSARNCSYLGLLTLAYILGEVAHFLINTTSRAVSGLVTSCRLMLPRAPCCRWRGMSTSGTCSATATPPRPAAARPRGRRSAGRGRAAAGTTPASATSTRWVEAGPRLAADPAVQLLAGPAFVAVFSVSGVLVAVTADRLRAAVSRVVLVGLGTATFSAGEQPLEAPRVTCPAQRVC